MGIFLREKRMGRILDVIDVGGRKIGNFMIGLLGGLGYLSLRLENLGCFV